MNSAEANKLIDKIIKEVEKNKFSSKLIELLKELRPYALQENDPLVTRSIRVSYEFIEATDGFDISLPEELEIEEEDALGYFTYLCGLWSKSDNKYNRDEIREIANAMTGAY